MEENPIIVIASKTLIDMCISFGLGKITQETFVGNLEIFANSCRAAITEEGAGTSDNKQSVPCEHNVGMVLGRMICRKCGKLL